MAKNKLYELLSRLSKRELQDFRLFLLSPYHNQSPIITALFDYIRPFHPDFEHKKLDSQLIFDVLEENRPEDSDRVIKSFDQKYVNDRLSDLNKLLKNFLAIQYIKKKPDENKLLYKKALLEHRCYDIYLRISEKEIEKFNKKPRLNWQDNLELWSLYHTLFSLPQTQQFCSENNIVLNASTHLDEAYAILKLRYGLHELHRQNIFEVESKILFLKVLLEQYTTSENPVIQLYRHAIAYFQSNDKEVSWQSLRALYFEHIAILPPEEKLIFLRILANSGYQLAKEKKDKYYHETLLLYQQALPHKFWQFLGEIPSITFRNIVSLGASTKQTNWTFDFIQDYQQFLPKQVRKNIVAYTNAYLAFHKGNFQKVSDYLQQTHASSFDTLEDKISIRSLECRCLYEIDCPTLSKRLDAFDKFIKHQRLQKDKKESYLNLIYAIRLLSKKKAKNGISQQEKGTVLAKINKRKRYVAYSWILRKIDKL